MFDGAPGEWTEEGQCDGEARKLRSMCFRDKSGGNS